MLAAGAACVREGVISHKCWAGRVLAESMPQKRLLGDLSLWYDRFRLPPSYDQRQVLVMKQSAHNISIVSLELSQADTPLPVQAASWGGMRYFFNVLNSSMVSRWRAALGVFDFGYGDASDV